MSDITKLTLIETVSVLSSREVSAFDVATAYLEEIETHERGILAYREVYSDVLDQAKEADGKIKGGESGKLLGIPIAVKDNILVKGRHAGAGSKILEGYRASYDATAVSLLKKEGAIFLGRTNQDEFAMGSSTENSAYQITHNPVDLDRVPGGSSGGSAAAVAANMAVAALGTDTGGSVRQPAAFCGIVGFKPTYGTISRYGMMAMAASLNQVGTLTKTVADAELLFDVLKTEDLTKDSNSVPLGKRVCQTRHGDGKKLGVPRDFLKEGVSEVVREKFEATLNDLARKGYEIIDIELPNLHYILPVYYILMPAEISTDLARFDGMRYGLSVAGENVMDVYKKSRGVGFGSEPRRRILLGTYVLSAGYYNAYYDKACQVRELVRSDFVRAYKDVDAIITPTTPEPAFKIGDKVEDPLSMYLQDIFTVSANVAGIPAISVPCGTASVDGKDLPIGFQIMRPWFGEDDLFRIAKDVTGEK